MLAVCVATRLVQLGDGVLAEVELARNGAVELAPDQGHFDGRVDGVRADGDRGTALREGIGRRRVSQILF